MDFLSSILPAVDHFHSFWYWIAFFSAFFETTIGVGLLFPGSTVILLMGAFAATGYFDLGDLIWFSAIGAILGDNLNYFLGRKTEQKLFKRGWLFMRPKHLKKGERFFKKYGPKSIFIGRFVPSLKEITPFVAGALRMNRANFMLWNFFGAIGWSLLWVLSGYFLGHSFNIAQLWLTRGGLLLLAMVLLFALLYSLEIFFVRRSKEIVLFFISVWRSIVESVSENPDVKKLQSRHVRFFRFLGKRLQRADFYGLPLTLLVLAFVYVLLLFGGTVEDILNSDLIVDVDLRIANLLALFHDVELIKFFLWITFLGKFQTVAVFLSSTVFLLWLWGKRQYILPLLIAVSGSQMFTFLGKLLFQRPRPNTALYLEQTFSFPSGHATVATAFYGFIVYILFRNTKNLRRKVDILFVGVVLISLIGFSRLYLGVHYLSDVSGGYLIGILWLILGIILSELFQIKWKKHIPKMSIRGKIFVSFSVVFLSLALYASFVVNFTPSLLDLVPENALKTVEDPNDVFTNDALRYTETLFGNQQEPLSFIIMAEDDDQLVNFFEAAHWELAQEITFSTIWEATKSLLFATSYPTAPMTPVFWHTKVHDFGFEKQTALDNIRERHHARFWKTDYITANGSAVYVGTASFDDGIKWGITHRISPDIDTEREFLFNDLKKTGQIQTFNKEAFVSPVLGKNFTGDAFFTDGNLYLITLK